MGQEPKNGKTSAPILSILIPTYNRFDYVTSLMSSFIENRHLIQQIDLEFIISENVPAEESTLIEAVNDFKYYFEVILVNPAQHLISAEENLFFGWQYVSGKYVWILGDDDPVNFEVFLDLQQRCVIGKDSIFKYNANILYSNHQEEYHLVTKCSVPEITMNFLEFLQNVGFWHTGAGFSTWVFHNKFIDPNEGLRWVTSFRSPVYAHVTYFVSKCFKDEITFVNKPLVNYRVNDYVMSNDDHWSSYAKRAEMPQYYPWTLGFVNQLLVLEELKIIKREYWGNVIGDHFNSPRFLEFNSMVSLAYRQMQVERDSNEYALKDDEWKFLISFFESIRPELGDIWKLFYSYLSIDHDQTIARKRFLRRIYLGWYSYIKSNEFGYFLQKNTINKYIIDRRTYFATPFADLPSQLFLGEIHKTENKLKHKNLRNLLKNLKFIFFCHARKFISKFSLFFALKAPDFFIFIILGILKITRK